MATFVHGGVLITRATAAAATATATLDAPATGQCTKILWIECFSTGATVAGVAVQKNDGTEITAQGGAGIGILSAPITFPERDARGGLCGAAADATKVVLTTTGGNPTTVTVGYQMVPA